MMDQRINCYGNKLQAVPFWIVERSREIAEREKKTRANERKGAWGEAGKRGKEKKGTALLAVTDEKAFLLLASVPLLELSRRVDRLNLRTHR